MSPAAYGSADSWVKQLNPISEAENSKTQSQFVIHGGFGAPCCDHTADPSGKAQRYTHFVTDSSSIIVHSERDKGTAR